MAAIKLFRNVVLILNKEGMFAESEQNKNDHINKMTENNVLRLKIIRDTLIRRSYENNDRNFGSRQFSL